MTGRIFISYRRDDAAGEAGRIHDRLRQDFGPSLLFMDCDAIPLGEDFLEVLQSSIRNSAALIAVIGPNWLEMKDPSGKRRLDDPRDVGIDASASIS